MGTNSSKEKNVCAGEPNFDDIEDDVIVDENDQYRANRYVPNLELFQGYEITPSEYLQSKNNSAGYDSMDYDNDEDGTRLQQEEEGGPTNNHETMMRTFNGGRDPSLLRSRTTYIDLDLLATLETRISNLRDRNGCPIYYLGWTQQKSKPWPTDTQPNSFWLEQARAIVLHLPPSLKSQMKFTKEAKLPKHLLLLVNEGSTCGELIEFCNQILTNTTKQKPLSQAVSPIKRFNKRTRSADLKTRYTNPGKNTIFGSPGQNINSTALPKIVALRSVATGNYSLYCLDFYLTQQDLPLGRLSKKMETHIVPILYQQQQRSDMTNPTQITSNKRSQKKYFQQNSSSKSQNRQKQLHHYYSLSPKRLAVSRNVGPKIQTQLSYNSVVGLMTDSIKKQQSMTPKNLNYKPFKSNFDITDQNKKDKNDEIELFDVLQNFSTGGLGIKNYEMLIQVGQGGFSKVILARQITTGKLCAMKVISIEELLSHGVLKKTILEREILVNLKHPFIVDFVEAFRTQKYLYLVLEFCPAGELFYHLGKHKKFSEEDARIIIAEIILAMEHLHKHNIIYRDLKPENVLVDFRGHIKLTDFGLCKERKNRDDQCKSLCGSPEYICPEMLNTGVHTRMVDFYQIGALLYELLTGLPPNYANDKKEMFNRISNVVPPMPRYLSEPCKDLLKGLLEKNPEKRLGFANDYAEVKSQAFFARIDWDQLMKKSRFGPLKPHLSGYYFDKEYVADLVDSEVKEMTLEWVDYEQRSNQIISQYQSNLLKKVRHTKSSAQIRNTQVPNDLIGQKSYQFNQNSIKPYISKANNNKAYASARQNINPSNKKQNDESSCSILSKQESQVFAEFLMQRKDDNSMSNISPIRSNKVQLLSNNHKSVNSSSITAGNQLYKTKEGLESVQSRQKPYISPMLAPIVSPNEAVVNLQTEFATPIMLSSRQMQLFKGVMGGLKISDIRIPDSGQMPVLGNSQRDTISQNVSMPSCETEGDDDQQVQSPQNHYALENAQSSQPSLVKRGMGGLNNHGAEVRPFILKHSGPKNVIHDYADSKRQVDQSRVLNSKLYINNQVLTNEAQNKQIRGHQFMQPPEEVKESIVQEPIFPSPKKFSSILQVRKIGDRLQKDSPNIDDVSQKKEAVADTEVDMSSPVADIGNGLDDSKIMMMPQQQIYKVPIREDTSQELNTLRSLAHQRRPVKPQKVNLMQKQTCSDDELVAITASQQESEGNQNLKPITSQQIRIDDSQGAVQQTQQNVLGKLLKFISERRRHYIQLNQSQQKNTDSGNVTKRNASFNNLQTPKTQNTQENESLTIRQLLKPKLSSRTPNFKLHLTNIKNSLTLQKDRSSIKTDHSIVEEKVWQYEYIAVPTEVAPLNQNSFSAAKKIYSATILESQLNRTFQKKRLSKLLNNNKSQVLKNSSSEQMLYHPTFRETTIKLSQSSNSHLSSHQQTLKDRKKSANLSTYKKQTPLITPIKSIPLICLPTPELENKNLSANISPSARSAFFTKTSVNYAVSTTPPIIKDSFNIAVSRNQRNINNSRSILCSSASQASLVSSNNRPLAVQQLDIPPAKILKSISRIEQANNINISFSASKRQGQPLKSSSRMTKSRSRGQLNKILGQQKSTINAGSIYSSPMLDNKQRGQDRNPLMSKSFSNNLNRNKLYSDGKASIHSSNLFSASQMKVRVAGMSGYNQKVIPTKTSRQTSRNHHLNQPPQHTQLKATISTMNKLINSEADKSTYNKNQKHHMSSHHNNNNSKLQSMSVINSSSKKGGGLPVAPSSSHNQQYTRSMIYLAMSQQQQKNKIINRSNVTNNNNLTVAVVPQQPQSMQTTQGRMRQDSDNQQGRQNNR